jgi:hypothetical protein
MGRLWLRSYLVRKALVHRKSSRNVFQIFVQRLLVLQQRRLTEKAWCFPAFHKHYPGASVAQRFQAADTSSAAQREPSDARPSN